MTICRTVYGMSMRPDGTPVAQDWPSAMFRLFHDPHHPQCLYQGPAPVQLQQSLAYREVDEELAVYSGVMANDATWMELTYGEIDQFGNLERRWSRRQLTIDPSLIHSRLQEPEGTPMAWHHDLGMAYSSPPIGKVLDAYVDGNKLYGDLEISNQLLSQHLPGGLATVDKGICTGLSIGFKPMEDPILTKRAGTLDNPDELKFLKISLMECSLVSVPALSGAAILGRKKKEMAEAVE